MVLNKGDHIEVTGNRCPKGQEFAMKELTDPERVLTTTVKGKNSRNLISVKSNFSVKKAELPALVHQLSGLTFDTPVKIGQTLIVGLGKNKVSIIATSDSE